MTEGGWKVLHEQELLNCPPWVKVVAETIQLEDGRTVIDDFYRVDIPDFAIIFAVTGDRWVVLVEQYRHALRRPIRELPSGIVAADETPLAAAKRELLEETGMQAPEWHNLGAFTVDVNRGCGQGHAFLALGAQRAGEPVAIDLQQQSVHFYDLEQLREFWLSDQCCAFVSTAVIGLGLAQLEARGVR